MSLDYEPLEQKSRPLQAEMRDENAAERLLDEMGEQYYDDAESLNQLEKQVEDAATDRLARVVDNHEWFDWEPVDTTPNGVELTDAGKAAYDADDDDEDVPDAEDVRGPWWLEGEEPPTDAGDATEVTHGDD